MDHHRSSGIGEEADDQRGGAKENCGGAKNKTGKDEAPLKFGEDLPVQCRCLLLADFIDVMHAIGLSGHCVKISAS